MPTKTITLTADEAQHLESLAVVRNMSHDAILREALAEFGGRRGKGKRLTPEELDAAEQLRPSRR